MPTTTEALVIAVLFLAPGLLYEWANEIGGGYRRPDSATKTLLAFARSVVAQLFLWPVVLLSWREYRGTDLATVGLPELLPLSLWLLLYAALPFAAGWKVGRKQKKDRGSTPSAWDALFDVKASGYVRARLRDGTWVGGVYAEYDGMGSAAKPFASAYPDPESLYLPTQLVLDPGSGEMKHDEQNIPRTREWGLLVHGADIEILEFQPFLEGVKEDS